MASLTPFWRSARWREAVRPGAPQAHVEGLAAGTGLLTGSLARSVGRVDALCPACDADGEIVVIDLVAHAVSLRCPACGHRWAVDEAEIHHSDR